MFSFYHFDSSHYLPFSSYVEKIKVNIAFVQFNSIQKKSLFVYMLENRLVSVYLFYCDNICLNRRSLNLTLQKLTQQKNEKTIYHCLVLS